MSKEQITEELQDLMERGIITQGEFYDIRDLSVTEQQMAIINIIRQYEMGTR